MRHNTEKGEDGEYAHTPVMWREVLQYAREIPAEAGGVMVDCTVGEGGHSGLLLREFPEYRLVGFERDAEIMAIASGRLEGFGERLTLFNDNFAHLALRLGEMAEEVRLMLFDFGISSYHFDRSGRGFSFRAEEPLDMRLDAGLEIDAAHIVNRYSENELTEIFSEYGEERWARKIARDICAERKVREIRTTTGLAELVLHSIPRRFHVKNIHPATRVFQALRIAVNGELQAIEGALRQAAAFLGRGGRIMAISFHSLEDRIVKNEFRRLAAGCTCGAEPAHCRCMAGPIVKIVTRKPVAPGDDEVEVNRRARSAKMRVCEKL